MHKYLELMRFHKPIGTWLLLWPTWFALLIATKVNHANTYDIFASCATCATDAIHSIRNISIIFMHYPKQFIVFTLGVVIMRAAGCVINDYADVKFDQFVTRTKTRPLATNQVNKQEALILFAMLLSLAFILVLTLNKLTIMLAFGAAGFAILYPFTKRFTYFPQLFLGIAFSFAILMAFAAIQNTIPAIAGLLFFGNICWTIAYDTQYALVDLPDDLKIGVKSTAIAFGDYAGLIIFILQGFFVTTLLLTGLLLQFGIMYYLSIIIIVALFWWQHGLMAQAKAKASQKISSSTATNQPLTNVNITNNNVTTSGYFKAFLNNNWVGLSMVAGLIFS